MNSGKTIITHLVDGTVSGIKTIEFSNGLIKGVSIPRKDIKEAFSYDDLSKGGVYFLIGEDEYLQPKVYIGQAINFSSRLKDHLRDVEKDFWYTAIIFTYKDGSLNESDINYLEKEIIKEAKNVGRYKLANGNLGKESLIQQHRKIDMTEFIENTKILLSILGFYPLKKVAEKEKNSKKADKDNNEENNRYYLNIGNTKAVGTYTEEGFVVFEGSYGVDRDNNSIVKGYKKLKTQLLEEGVLKKDNGNIIFTKDYIFSSPTPPAQILLGYSVSGPKKWYTNKGEKIENSSLFDDNEVEDTNKGNKYYLYNKGANAAGIFDGELITVLKGSKLVGEITNSGYKNNIDKKRKKLLDEGIIEEKDSGLFFKKDYKSTINIASTIIGHPVNAWNEWKNENGKTLDEVERKKFKE